MELKARHWTEIPAGKSVDLVCYFNVHRPLRYSCSIFNLAPDASEHDEAFARTLATNRRNNTKTLGTGSEVSRKNRKRRGTLRA